MPFKFSLLTDVSDVVRGMAQVEDALEETADVLDDLGDDAQRSARKLEDGFEQAGRAADDLGDDAQRSARKLEDGFEDAARGIDSDAEKIRTAVSDATDKAADDGADSFKKLEKKFSDAVKGVLDDSKKMRKIGDDVTDATDRASEGVTEFKDEAASSVRETAASFGSVEDALDAVQEIAANALAGFGPAGAVAGIAAAAGIGIAISKLQEFAEKINETTEEALDLAGTLADADLNPGILINAERLREVMSTIVDERKWWELWQDRPITMMEQLKSASEEFGFSFTQLAQGVAGDSEQLEAALEMVNERIDAQREAITYADAATGIYTTTVGTVDAELTALRDTLQETADKHALAAEYAELMAEAEGGLADTVADAAAVQESYADAVTDSLTEAGQSWEDYTEDGIVNLAKYNDAIEAQAEAVRAYEENMVTVSKDLSAEALTYIASLGPSAAPLLQSFINAPLAEKQRTAANWDTLGRASTDGYKGSFNLTNTVQSELNRAQTTANASPIRTSFALNSTGLQTQLNTAVARLYVPTVRVDARLSARMV